MDVKQCSKCKETKSVSNFNKKSINKYQPYCRPCDNARAREYYAANGDKMRKQISIKRKERVSSLSSQINEIKESTPCADCGEKYPYYVMDFDHIQGEKFANVSVLRNSGVSKKVWQEIEKCEIVCANCHRQRTHQRRLYKKHDK